MKILGGKRMVKRIVDTDFWTSRQVIDKYSVEDKFFALYLMTNGRSTQVGIYSLPKKVMSFETGYTTEVIEVLIDRFSKEYGEIVYSERTQEVTLLKSLSYSILTGGRPVHDLLERELRAVEDGTLILETYQAMQEFWNTSIRKFDQTIQQIFEVELSNRGIINLDNHNQNHNQKHSHNHNHIHIHNKNHNHNHNQESSSTTREGKKQPTRKQAKNEENEEIAIERYISYLKHKKPGFNQVIDTEDILCVFYKELLGEVTLDVLNHFKDWEGKLPKSIILEALVRSEDKIKPISYAGKIIDNWLEHGVKNTLDIARLDRVYNRES